MRCSAWIPFCLIFLSAFVQAQNIRYGLVKGVVMDSLSCHPIESASIRLYLISDSSIVNYALSNRKGEFTLNDIPFNTKCQLVITSKGYDDFSLSFTLLPESKEERFYNIRLVKGYNELKAVTITALRPLVTVKQDTLEFNSSSLKTMPNAMVEDLMKQLPGVEIDRDGNITINGKKVTKIMVEGREFFGDPKVAIKNLPKDIIDKLQVTDNKSREAQFNKTTTGNEDLALNLILKKEVQKGWFGKVSAGLGSGGLYEGDAMLNYFHGSKQLNFIGNSNNTNRGSITSKDFNISNTSSTLNGGGDGLTHSTSGGVNFGTNLGAQVKLNGSYFYNNRHSDNFSRLQRKNILPDTAFFYNADNSSGSHFVSHTLSLNGMYNIDTLTELNINSYLSTYSSQGLTLNKAYSIGLADQLINTSENNYASNADSKYIASELFFSHRFIKSGRGVTLGLNYNYNDFSSTNDNIGQNDYYKNGSVDSTELVNQRSFGKYPGRVLSLKASYAEPLSKHITVILIYNYDKNTRFSEKYSNRYDSTTGKYDIEDSAYTNVFRNVRIANNSEINLSFNKNKYRAAIGSGLQFMQQDNVTGRAGALLHQSYVNFAPFANLRYSFRKAGSVSVFYNASCEQPSIQQLQPVPDNSNPLHMQLGNPYLRPSFIQNINIQVRELKGSNYWFTGLNFSITQDQIITETWFDNLGKQVSQPININGNYGMSGNFQYTHTWKNRNATLRLNLGSRGYFNRNNSVVNKVQISSNGYSVSPSIGLNFLYKQLLSVIPSFNISYNNTSFSSESIQNTDFNTKTFSVSAFWNYPKWLIVENNLEYYYNSKIAAGFRKNVTMWSAALNCLLFNKQQGMLRLAVYDILKQSAGVYRSITPTYIEDRQTKVLQSYFLVSLIYNLKKPGTK
jgi:hypothetical protein